MESKLNPDGNLERVIKLNVNDGRVTISEVDDDANYLTVMSSVGHTTVSLKADQLWALAVGVLELFGAKAVRYDEVRAESASLRAKIFDVLVDNEARCLDDNVDRDHVLGELVKALAPEISR
jgi:hypothetical protein